MLPNKRKLLRHLLCRSQRIYLSVAQQRKQKYGPEKMYGEDNAVADYDFGGKMVPCMNIGKYRNVPLEYIAEHDQSYLQWCISDKCNFMPASKNFIKKYIK